MHKLFATFSKNYLNSQLFQSKLSQHSSELHFFYNLYYKHRSNNCVATLNKSGSCLLGASTYESSIGKLHKCLLIIRSLLAPRALRCGPTFENNVFRIICFSLSATWMAAMGWEMLISSRSNCGSGLMSSFNSCFTTVPLTGASEASDLIFMSSSVLICSSSCCLNSASACSLNISLTVVSPEN